MHLSRDFMLHEFLRSETAARQGREIVASPEVIAALKELCVNILQPLRSIIGKTITITSGYRPDWLNMMIGGSMASQHMYGEAADIVAQGFRPKELCQAIIAMDLPFDQLILEFDKWTHVSYSSKMRRQVLTARYVNGRTQYEKGLV